MLLIEGSPWDGAGHASHVAHPCEEQVHHCWCWRRWLANAAIPLVCVLPTRRVTWSLMVKQEGLAACDSTWE